MTEVAASNDTERASAKNQNLSNLRTPGTRR